MNWIQFSFGTVPYILWSNFQHWMWVEFSKLKRILYQTMKSDPVYLLKISYFQFIKVKIYFYFRSSPNNGACQRLKLIFSSGADQVMFCLQPLKLSLFSGKVQISFHFQCWKWMFTSGPVQVKFHFKNYFYLRSSPNNDSFSNWIFLKEQSK